MLHKRDEHAVEGWDPEDHPESVLSAAARTTRSRRTPTASGRATASDARGLRTRSSSSSPRAADELAALDALGAKGTWTFAGRELALTNLDKVLFPARDGDDPLTKRDLIRYYAQVAPMLLPYLDDRPLNLHRFPDGVRRSRASGRSRRPKHAPDWITPLAQRRTPTRARASSTSSPTAPAALAWLANHAAVELHAVDVADRRRATSRRTR